MKRYKKLTILHSNDMHWDFFSEEWHDSLVGGICMLSWYIKKTKEKEKNCIYTISWDMFQWSVIDNDYKWISTIDIMNILSPDVVTLWNHEIDYWLAHLLFLEKMATFPIINANLYITTNQSRLFKPYYIKEIDWMKILFIWIITEEILSSVKSDNMISTFIWVEEAAREVEKICNSHKAIDIDLTVLLTHVGYENDLKLAELLNPELWVDIIIWWHSHTLLDKPTKINDILITQVWVWTNQIWRFDLKIDTKENKIEKYKWKSITINNKHCKKDKKVEKILNWYKDATDKKYNKVLSKMTKDLSHPTRIEETEVWNLFADIFKNSLWIDIMCLWTGSLRSEVLESIVTLWELKEMYPYGNKIYSLKMTWEEINKMIQNIYKSRFVESWEEFYAWSEWISITYDSKKNEIKKILFNWKPLKKEKVYNVWLQKFHFDNVEKNMKFDPYKLESWKNPKIVCTNDFDILEEYFLTNPNSKTKIEWRIIFE